MAQEASSLGKLGLGAEEDELARVVQFDQLGQKQSAEELAQHPDRQKKLLVGVLNLRYGRKYKRFDGSPCRSAAMAKGAS
jgi:hypothetical protein